MKKVLSCPKCKEDMVQGFIPDFSHGAKYVSSWLEGQPEKSFWLRTKVPFEGGIPIGAFRCKGCGFLEFYSNEGFAAQ